MDPSHSLAYSLELMDAAPISRMRWRLRGAWMWPAFIVLTAVDGYVWHRLPTVGDSMNIVGAYILAAVVNLIAIVALAPVGGLVIRRFRGDMPKLVASDYAGTFAVGVVTLAILAAGIVHHQVVSTDSAALRSAAAIAETYIADHAPAQFTSDLRDLDVFEVQPPRVYRACAQNAEQTRWYCVIVGQNPALAGQRSHGLPIGYTVHFDGTESNELLSRGTS